MNLWHEVLETGDDGFAVIVHVDGSEEFASEIGFVESFSESLSKKISNYVRDRFSNVNRNILVKIMAGTAMLGTLTVGGFGQVKAAEIPKPVKTIKSVSKKKASAGSVSQVLSLQSPLKRGSRGSSVGQLQANLRLLGFFKYGINTGIYGSITANAVSSFQRSFGLPVTGTADSKTLTAIQQAVVKQKIVKDSYRYIGIPYRWGGTSPSGFDCSGFVYYMFTSHGVYLPRETSGALYQKGTPISRNNLKPGDLVFFAVKTPGVISHVGIYVGNNEFISATSSKGIAVASMDNPFWAPHYHGAKRVY